MKVNSLKLRSFTAPLDGLEKRMSSSLKRAINAAKRIELNETSFEGLDTNNC